MTMQETHPPGCRNTPPRGHENITDDQQEQQ